MLSNTFKLILFSAFFQFIYAQNIPNSTEGQGAFQLTKDSSQIIVQTIIYIGAASIVSVFVIFSCLGIIRCLYDLKTRPRKKNDNVEYLDAIFNVEELMSY